MILICPRASAVGVGASGHSWGCRQGVLPWALVPRGCALDSKQPPSWEGLVFTASPGGPQLQPRGGRALCGVAQYVAAFLKGTACPERLCMEKLNRKVLERTIQPSAAKSHEQAPGPWLSACLILRT